MSRCIPLSAPSVRTPPQAHKSEHTSESRAYSILEPPYVLLCSCCSYAFPFQHLWAHRSLKSRPSEPTPVCGLWHLLACAGESNFWEAYFIARLLLCSRRSTHLYVYFPPAALPRASTFWWPLFAVLHHCPHRLRFTTLSMQSTMWTNANDVVMPPALVPPLGIPLILLDSLYSVRLLRSIWCSSDVYVTFCYFLLN